MSARPDAQSVAELRPFLMRVAIARLRDDQVAEDVVQEAMAAALDKLQTFKAQSQLRTWVTGILLHKVTDTFRATTREKTMRVMPQQSDAEDPDFDAEGTWRAPSATWCDPELALDARRFRAAFEAALAQLPEFQARAFVLREVHGLESDAICSQLEISESNLLVLLHRARLALRRSLDRDWFAAA